MSGNATFLVEGRGLSDLARYFDIQAKWDSRKYSLVTEDDMIFRHQAAKRFNDEISKPAQNQFRRRFIRGPLLKQHSQI